MRTTTWENIGTNVIGSTSVHDALTTAGLDFTVSKQPLFTEFNNTKFQVPNKLATVREDTGDVLGIVGKDYNVCQNADAFDFVDYVSNDLELEKAGMTASGLMYVIAKLPSVSILGDEFVPHLIFQNGFNGGYPVRAAICPLRIVCQNQLALSFKNTPNAISIRHSASLQEKLDAAKQTFLETAEYMKELNKQAEKLASKHFSEAEFTNLIESWFKLEPDMTKIQTQRILDVRAAMYKAYIEDDNSNFKGTAWGAINAVSDYLTHKQPTRKSAKFTDNHFMSVTFNPVLLQSLYSMLA